MRIITKRELSALADRPTFSYTILSLLTLGKVPQHVYACVLFVKGTLMEQVQDTRQDRNLSHLLNKVPEISIWFWIVKILATTVGETAADFLNETLHFGLTGTTLVMSLALVGGLVWQFRCKQYVPTIYWIAVVLISVVGTLITDNLTDRFNVSLILSSVVFAVALTAVFLSWFVVEKTMSIHSIRTTRREAFYWGAILLTFALGTASGDLVAERYDIGYWKSALLFAGLIALITCAFRFLRLNAVAAFWAAYILTRPLGASIGDYMSQSKDDGGLALGTTGTSAIFLTVIAAVVVYLNRLQKRDQIRG